MTKITTKLILSLITVLNAPFAFAEKYYTTEMTVDVVYSDLEAQQNQEYVGQSLKYRVRFAESGSVANFHELQKKVVFSGELNGSLNSTIEDGGLVTSDIDEITKYVWVGSNKKGASSGSTFFMEDCQMKARLSKSFARYLGEQSIALAWDRQQAGSARSEESAKAMNLIQKASLSSEDELNLLPGLVPTLVNINAQPECANVSYNGPSEIQFHETYKIAKGIEGSHAAHVVIRLTAPEVRNNL